MRSAPRPAGSPGFRWSRGSGDPSTGSGQDWRNTY